MDFQEMHYFILGSLLSLVYLQDVISAINFIL